MTNELQHLKDIALKLKVNYSPNIGMETLKSKVKDYCTETGIPLDDPILEGIFSESVVDTSADLETKPEEMDDSLSQPKSPKKVTSNKDEIERLSQLTFEGAAKSHAEEMKQTAYRRAMKLVRCRITCNNPNKRSYTGDIFFARNKVIPGIKKMIPFNVPTHVPQILLNVIKEKQLQTFVTKRLPNGIETKTSKLVPEYNIEMLEPLTTEEFNAIRQRQLAEGNE